MIVAERDPRTMNRMDPQTRVVHARLEAWGKWAKEHHAAWPSVTMLGKVIVQGFQGASQAGRPPISMPESVALTDAAVARLGDVEQRVVITYYTAWAPVEVMAKEHHCGVRQFQSILRRARGRLSLVLT